MNKRTINANLLPGRRILYLLAFLVLGVWACTKTDEPSHPVGQTVPYTSGTTQTIDSLLDSLPGITFFDSAYRHAGMGAYLDTLRKMTGKSPFTLFIPSDAAFMAAGYTLQQIGQSTPAELDSLLMYCTVEGNYTYASLDSFTGNVTIGTLLKDPNLHRSLPNSGYSTGTPYQYMLYAGLENGTLWLDGIPVKTAAQSLQATNGVVWIVDKLTAKPSEEIYQILTQDTSYSYYMAAVRYSDGIYHSNLNYDLGYYFSDTLGFQIQQGQGYLTVLAPTNDAFRAAGFATVASIYNYIDASECVNNGGMDAGDTVCRTNMDSILDLHRMGYAPSPEYFGNEYVTTILYTNDMLYNPHASNLLLKPGDAGLDFYPPVSTGVFFDGDSGQVTVHRVDAPGGRAVHVINPHDITALNGVVHRVDNLLLTTP